jgi:hypothetical protein
MGPNRCKVCARDVGRAALVRCTESRCPLKTERTSSFRSAMNIGFMGALIAVPLLIVVVLVLTHHQSKTEAYVASGDSSSASSAPPATSGSGFAWVSGLFAGKDAQPVDNAPPEPAIGAPDPQASTRVQTFSCGGALSASRASICTHWELATADYNLSLLYNSALAHSAHAPELRRDHASFLKALDQLDGNPERILALYQAWQARLAAALPRAS